MATHEAVVVEVVLVPDALADTDEALLVMLAAVLVQAVRVVEPALAEAAHGVLLLEVVVELGVAPPAASAAPALALARQREELVLVRKDLLVGAAQVAEGAVVRRADVPLKVGPAREDVVARLVLRLRGRRGRIRQAWLVRTVEAQERERVLELGARLEEDAELCWCRGVVSARSPGRQREFSPTHLCVAEGRALGRVVLERLVVALGKDDGRAVSLRARRAGEGQLAAWVQIARGKQGTHLAEGALLLLVEGAEADRAGVAGAVIARRDRPVDDGFGADEADGVVVGRLSRVLRGFGHGARNGVDLEDALVARAGGGALLLGLLPALLLPLLRAPLALCSALVTLLLLLTLVVAGGSRGRGEGGGRGGGGFTVLPSQAPAESCTA